MRLHELRPAKGAKKRPKRVGRGKGSGHGKTSTRGQKGQGARSGGGKGPGFEGGQTPLQRRLPKLRGASGKSAMPRGMFRKEQAIVNLFQLRRFEKDMLVNPETLLKHRVISSLKDGLTILGKGKLTQPLRIEAHHFSKSASEKIKRAGGEVIKIKYQRI